MEYRLGFIPEVQIKFPTRNMDYVSFLDTDHVEYKLGFLLRRQIKLRFVFGIQIMWNSGIKIRFLT